MSTRDDLTTAASAGLKARQGYAYFHCAEMIFGSTIRAKPGTNPPEPDTSISWTARNAGGLRVQSSVDDGNTWQDVPYSGAPIPSPQGVPWPIGQVLTNKQVLLRQIFLDGAPGTVLDSITVTLTTHLGEVVTRTESGAALAQGTLLGCAYDSAAGINGVHTRPQVFLQFQGNRGGLYRTVIPHDAGGQPQDLHLSHGDAVTGVYGPAAETENPYNLDARTKASLSIELWIYPQQTTGTLWGWQTLTRDRRSGAFKNEVGVRCYLEETTAIGAQSIGAARVLVDIWRYAEHADRFEMSTPADVVVMNQWTHVAFTYDGLWGSLYVNAVLLAHFNTHGITGLPSPQGTSLIGSVGHILRTEGDFIVGRFPLPAGNNERQSESFKGYMSELRVYQSCLTPGKIVQRMRRRFTGAQIDTLVVEERLRAYYGLYDDGAQFAFDQTGNNLHLVFNQQQIYGSPTLPPQLGYAGVNNLSWIGVPYPYTPSGPESVPYSPARTSPPFSVDVPGDVMRLTNAPHSITLPAPDGRVFAGVGQLGTLNAVQEPADLIPTEMTLMLTGVPAQYVSLALRAIYLDRPCAVYLVLLDPAGHVVNAQTTVFEGRMDRLDISMQAEDEGGTLMAACQLTAESHLRRWSEPGHQRWNYQAQLDAYGDDFGFEFLEAMVDREVWWPSQLPTEQGGGGGLFG